VYHLEKLKLPYATIIGTKCCPFDMAQRQNLDKANIPTEFCGYTILQILILRNMMETKKNRMSSKIISNMIIKCVNNWNQILSAGHDTKTEPRSSYYIESVLRMYNSTDIRMSKKTIMCNIYAPPWKTKTPIRHRTKCGSFDTAQKQNLDQANIPSDLCGYTIMLEFWFPKTP
jgi:hypothetical protein